MVQKNKLNVGFFSLTSCEGCYFAILDKTCEFIALNNRITIKICRLFEDDTHLDEEKFDLVFIEGSPLTEENREQVKRLRRNAKTVVALGSCACMGGIYHLKQYQDKSKIFNQVYQKDIGIENYDVKPLEELIKIDHKIPGCPISAREFMGFVYGLLVGKKIESVQNPVCYECQIRGYECLLQKGQTCLGPITFGGCEAICLKSKQGCWGCRGLLDGAEVSNWIKKMRENYSDKEITKYLEVFGIKEQINKL